MVAFLAFVPWLAMTSDKLGAHAGLSKPMLLMWTPYTVFTFLTGFSLGPSVRELRVDGPGAALVRHAAWILVAAVAGAVALVAGLRRTLRADTRWAGIWCLIWAVLPVGLAIAGTFVTNISYNVRYAIVSYPPIVLLLAAAVVQARRSLPIALAVCALAVCVAVSLRGWYGNPSYGKEEIRPLAAMLREQYGRGHVLVVANEGIRGLLRYYGAPLPADALLLRETDDTPTSHLGAIHAAIERSPARPDVQVWLIEYRPWETDEIGAVRTKLDSAAELQERREWPGVALRVYRVRTRS